MQLTLRSVLVAAAIGAASVSAGSNCPEMCIDVYDPVCGSDGVTYPNSCYLSIAQCESDGKITEASGGECVGTVAPAGPATNATGSLDQEPVILAPSTSDSADDEPAVGTENCDDVMCTMQYDPVCGSDGVMYSNSCMLGIAQCKDPSITEGGAC